MNFMNEIVILLLNFSHSIILPSEDEALNPLHLILAFIPCGPRLKPIIAWLQSTEAYWFVLFRHFL